MKIRLQIQKLSVKTDTRTRCYRKRFPLYNTNVGQTNSPEHEARVQSNEPRGSI